MQACRVDMPGAHRLDNLAQQAIAHFVRIRRIAVYFRVQKTFDHPDARLALCKDFGANPAKICPQPSRPPSPLPLCSLGRVMLATIRTEATSAGGFGLAPDPWR